MKKQLVFCILNPKSGPSAGPTPEELHQLFSVHGVRAEVVNLEPSTDIDVEVKKAMSKGVTTIVAIGGDGTVSAVAAAVLRQEAGCLGILPLGTLNHFAKDLKIPLIAADAAAIICQGHKDAVDVAVVNHVPFLNNSSLGLYPAMVKLREKLQRHGRGKWWAALGASLRAILRFRRLHVEIQLKDGSTIRRRTSLLFVGNNAYITAGTKIGSRSSLKQGMLSVTVATSQSRWGLVKSFVAMMLGKDNLADVIQFDATSLTVTSKKKILGVATDGEVRKLVPPLQYEICPRALAVIVPPDR